MSEFHVSPGLMRRLTEQMEAVQRAGHEDPQYFAEAAVAVFGPEIAQIAAERDRLVAAVLGGAEPFDGSSEYDAALRYTVELHRGVENDARVKEAEAEVERWKACFGETALADHVAEVQKLRAAVAERASDADGGGIRVTLHDPDTYEGEAQVIEVGEAICRKAYDGTPTDSTELAHVALETLRKAGAR